MPPVVCNPGMLTLARESRGWTQEELAQAIGISQSKLSKFEIGALDPDEHELALIGATLHYDVEFFAQTDPKHAIGASLIYRQKASVPAKITRRIEAEINVRKMQVSRLLKGAKVDDHLFPSIPTDAVGGNVAAVARELRRIWKVPSGPIPDLTRLVEANGGIVVQMDFGTRLIDGAHLWVPGLPPMFFMSRDVPGERYRFSLAHELGHAVMHRASGIGEIEDEADVFASEFLMPGDSIRSDLRNFNLEVARRLKAFWKVSMQALIERAHDLQVITLLKRRRMHMAISAQGGRINEPWPLSLEKASQFDSLVAFHYDSLHFTNDEVRRIMFTDRMGAIPVPEEFRLRLVGESEGESLFSQPPALSTAVPQLSLRSPDAVQA